MRIRPATQADLDVIVRYNVLLAHETEHKALDTDIVRRGVSKVLEDFTKGLYFLVEDNGTVVGQLMVTTEWSDWRDGWFWWIQSVYVLAEYRRKGVFRALLEHVLAEARINPGIVSVRLYVEQENQIAQQTYTKLGLELTDYLVMERLMT